MNKEEKIEEARRRAKNDFENDYKKELKMGVIPSIFEVKAYLGRRYKYWARKLGVNRDG